MFTPSKVSFRKCNSSASQQKRLFKELMLLGLNNLFEKRLSDCQWCKLHEKNFHIKEKISTLACPFFIFLILVFYRICLVLTPKCIMPKNISSLFYSLHLKSIFTTYLTTRGPRCAAPRRGGCSSAAWGRRRLSTSRQSQLCIKFRIQP